MCPDESLGAALYFAYAANLSRAHMALWCPAAEALTQATLPDYRLVFRRWADVVPCRGERVPGALYRVTAADLESLDRFEECPGLYHRLAVRVVTDGPVRPAVTYQMNPGHPLALPDPDYLALILRGYADWGLDPAPLEALKRENHDRIAR